jgi:prepilin-type N-terminal cleavage/methylation domain-containing protein
MKKTNAQKGFTIVELALVIALTGILATFAVVSIWGAASTIKLNAAASKVISDIRFAQHLARTHNQWYGINFQSDPTNIYNVYHTDGSTDTTVVNPANKATDLQLNLNSKYKGVTISGVNIEGGSTVEFNPYGTPYDDMIGSPLTAAGTITLTLGGNSKVIQITPNTGKVELL